MREAKIVRIVTRPTTENDFWCDFLWENADQTRDVRCLQITHAQIDAFGFEYEEWEDDFAPEGIVLARGKCVTHAKSQNELTNYELQCIAGHFQDQHEPSEVFVARRVQGKRVIHPLKKIWASFNRRATIIKNLIERTGFLRHKIMIQHPHLF